MSLVLASTAAANPFHYFLTPAGNWHLGTFAVGNIDGGSDLEIVIPYRDSEARWFLDAYKWNGTRIAGFPYTQGLQEINASPTLYDLDGDGKDEIIFMCGASVIAMRGNGTIMWSNAVTRLNYIPDGGYQSTTNGFYWTGTGSWIPNLPTSAVFSSQFSPPIVADIDGNGVKEVVTAWKIDPDSNGSSQDYNPFINDVWGFGEWGTVGEVWSGGVVFFDAVNGSKRFVYHIHQLVENGIALGQADEDAPVEVYVLNDSDSVVCFDKTKPHGFHGKGMLHGQFGKNQQFLSGTYQQAIDIYTADLDGDGRSEVLVPMSQYGPFWQPNETILDDDGTILWRAWKQEVFYSHNHGWHNSACMIPVNPDRDNHIDVLTFTHSHEITYRYWNGIELVSHPGWPKNFAPHLPTPPVVGDVDGDGQEEIIIATYDPSAHPSTGKLYVFGLDGTQEHVIDVVGGVKQVPAIADVNGDGSVDVIVRALNGLIYLYNFGATPDARVSWSTHRGNMQRDGNRATSLFPPGTPRVTHKDSGNGRAHLRWSNTATGPVDGFRIYRSAHAAGPFVKIASLAPFETEFADTGLQPGWQYFYEVAAVIGGQIVRSAPVPVLSELNNNLLLNGGFEEDDDSRWDKWYTGDISWSDMVGSTNVVHGGKQSMAITLRNMGSQSSIKQFNQYGIPDASIPVVPGTLYSFGGFFRSGGISPASKHWLEWNPTITAGNTNPAGSYPYPNYFTPHFAPGTGASGWVYANRTFVMPPGFTAIELRHRYNVSGAANGTIYLDDLFFRPLPPATSPEWTDLVRFNSFWRYTSAAPASNWHATNFNDGAWSLGIAKFGCGGGPRGVLTQLPASKPAYYFRTQFVVTHNAFEELLLSALCTDDYGGVIYPMKVYLNGAELVTSGIEAVSGEGNDVKYYDLSPFANLLKPGTNTIAVMISNTWAASWDNVAFDINLKAIPAVTPGLKPTARIMSLQHTPLGVVLGISASAGTSWRIESTDQLQPVPNWQTVDTFTVPEIGAAGIMDTGQNGRLVPSQAPSRFYRVVPD